MIFYFFNGSTSVNCIFEIDTTYLNLNLANNPDDLMSLAKLGKSRVRVRAVESFCKNYLKNTNSKGKYAPFAEIIVEIIHNPKFDKEDEEE